MAQESAPPPYYTPSEHSSLLNRKPSRKSTKSTKLVSFVIAIVLLFISGFLAINAYYIAPKADEYINKSVEFDVDKVSLIGLTSDGIQVKIDGVSKINYDHIENKYFSKLFSAGGFLMHEITLNIDEIELAAFDDHTNEYFKLGFINVPKFTVNTGNNSFTNLELTPIIKPNSAEILKIIRKLLREPESVFILKGVTYITVYSGFLPLGRFPFDFNHNIPNIKFDKNDLVIENINLIETIGSGLTVDIASSVKNPLKNEPLSFSVPSFNWDFYVDDCFGDPSIKIASGKSFEFNISPLNDNLSVNVQSFVDSVPKELTITCEESKKSPLDFIVDRFIHTNEVSILVKCGESEGFLSGLSIPIDYKFPSVNITSNLIENVTLNNMDISFDKGPEEPSISGKVEAYVKLPKSMDLNVNVTFLKGKADLIYHNQKFGYVSIIDWVAATSRSIKNDEYNYLFVESYLKNLPVVIQNRSVFAEMIADIFGSGNVSIDIEALLDIIVNTILGDMQISDIPGNGNTVISKVFGLF